MNIYANGKNIQSYPFSSLFVQGERLADTIFFYVARQYEGNDLSACSFMIRGLNENNEEAIQPLIPSDSGDYICLEWKVTDYFTAVSGKLELEIRAVKEKNNETQLLVKYTMPPVFVKSSPTGENTPLPDTTEQSINAVTTAAADGVAQIQAAGEELQLDALKDRLDSMDINITRFLSYPKIVPITQQEYAYESHNSNDLYVIIG